MEEDLRKQLKIPPLQYSTPLIAQPAIATTQLTQQSRRLTDQQQKSTSPKTFTSRRNATAKKSGIAPKREIPVVSPDTDREVRIFISSPFKDMSEVIIGYFYFCSSMRSSLSILRKETS